MYFLAAAHGILIIVLYLIKTDLEQAMCDTNLDTGLNDTTATSGLI